MAKEYSFKSKDHEVLGVTPKDVALELARITKKHGGVLTRQDVVNASRKKTAVLHAQFTWDDGVAAEEYRKHEAGKIVHCVVVRDTDTQQISPTLIRVVAPEGSEAAGKDKVAYVQAADARDWPDVAERREKGVKDRLIHLRREYASVTKLKAVWDAIDKVCGS